METVRTYGEEEPRQVLEKLSNGEEYSITLRAKGMLETESKEWLYFDLVPEEHEVRKGQPTYTGRLCIIGSKLGEDKLRGPFRTEQEKVMAVPVYLLTGFLEGGKTTLVKGTPLDTGFDTGERTPLLACEEGTEDYDDDLLTKTSTALVTVGNKAAVNYEFLEKCGSLTEPNQVMVEFNGTWSPNSFVDIEYPSDWLLVQIPSTADTPTFEVYLNSIHSLTYDRLLHSETIASSRYGGTTKKLYLRNNIKTIDKGAQPIHETRDGQVVELGNDEMPFDLHADVIRIADDDYGLWYMDALEHPRKYGGKSIELKGEVIATHMDGVPNTFVLGRYAIACCADDISLIELLCHYEYASNLIPKNWVSITVQTAIESDEEYQGDVPVLYVKQLAKALPLDDKLVYFN